MDAVPFIYTSEPPNESQAPSLVLGNWIHSTRELFQAYFYGLPLPGWFGFNWDALQDVLTDLSWTDQSKLVLYHSQLPRLSPDELTIYLDILHCSVTRTPELQVLFQDSDREVVDSNLPSFLDPVALHHFKSPPDE